MKAFDIECRRLADIQGGLFEKSVTTLDMSSEVFIRRYMNSKVAMTLDNGSFMEDTKSVDDIFDELEQEYGRSDYGSKKYHKEVMFWSGYLYRVFCYTYEITSKEAYKLLPFKYIASTYHAYHSLDVNQAIERLLESRSISFKEEDIVARGVSILKAIKQHKNY